MDDCTIPQGSLFSSALNSTLTCLSTVLKKKKCLFSSLFVCYRWGWSSLVLSLSLSLAEQAVTISDSLQMDVVNAFQSGSTIQGALRRQPSIASQHHDVTNISTPTHVVFSSTTASTTVGCECVFLKCMKLTFPDSHT